MSSFTRLSLLHGLLWLGLIVIVSYNVLLPQTYFIDNRANLGTVRRSVLPEAAYPLETNHVNMFFEFQQLPGPEPWHRGASIWLLALFGAVVGTEREWVLRLPHLLWVSVWLLLAWRLVRSLASPAADNSAPSKPIPAVFVAAALVLTPWAIPLLQDAYLDDVPAAVCVLAALWLLARSDKLTAVLGAGALCGLAAFVKDFALLWGPIGVALVVVLGVWTEGWQAWRRTLTQAILFVVGFWLVASVKFWWSWVELGTLSGNPVTHFLRAGFFGRAPVDQLYPFFILAPDVDYTSRVALAGGVWPAVRALWRPVKHLVDGVQALAFAALWLLPLAWEQPRRWTRPRRVLIGALGLSFLLYALLFGLGLGQGDETRYWLVPVTLLTSLGVHALGVVGWRWWDAAGPARAGQLVIMALVFVWLYVQPLTLLSAAGSAEVPHSAESITFLNDNAAPDAAILADTRGGAYLYSVQPAYRTVAFPTYHLNRFDSAQADALFDAYTIEWALLNIEDGVNWLTLERLQAWGWQVAYANGWDVVLRRAPLE